MKFSLPDPSSAPQVLVLGATCDEASGLSLSGPEQLVARLTDHLQQEEFKAKAGEEVLIPALDMHAGRWILVVGMGSGSSRDHRRAGGAIGRSARSKKIRSAQLELGSLSSESIRAVVEGVMEGNYAYQEFFEEDKKTPALEEIICSFAEAAEVEVALAHAQAQALTRDLVNGPPANIYPETLAQAAAGLASDRLTVELWDKARLEQEGFVGTLAVGAGSSRPPVLAHMVWRPEGEPKARVVLVGKGVTFDAGGLSLKPTPGMQTMRCDMAGAGTVVGVMSALDRLNLPLEVHGIFSAAENMLGASAFKLGDILTMRNGKTVEIHNTDAEGRLLLADCLCYASTLDADVCVDMATLTGAAIVALGPHYTAVYSEDDELAEGLRAGSSEAGEQMWQLPLESDYKEMLKASWSTLKNVGGRQAGSITAALFLQEFYSGSSWAHLDIAGPSFYDKGRKHFAKGASGDPVRSVLRWLESYSSR